MFLDCDPKSNTGETLVSYFQGVGFLDCDPESKTGEIPKSHIFRGMVLGL